MTRSSPLLDAARRELGDAPRQLAPKALRKLDFKAPFWLRGDALEFTSTSFPELLREGWLTWAGIVVANTALWKPGHQVSAAAIVHGIDPAYDPPLVRLQYACAQVASLRADGPRPASLDALTQCVRDDRGRHMKVPLPRSLTAGLPLAYSSVLVVPQHLPVPHLVASFLPVIVHPTRDLVAVLPAPFWGEDLVRAWREWEPD